MRESKLNTFFDAVFVINLDKRTDRLAHVMNQLEQIGVTNALRFSAIDGNEVNYNGKLKPGEVGCMLSHLGIVKYAKEQGLKSIFIVEDDVVFADNFNELLAQSLNELPSDWCLFYAGANNLKPVTRLTNYISKANGTLALHAYAIHEQFYDVIIDEVEKEFDKQIDVYYYVLQQKYPCYCSHPKIAFQLDGYSDIQNQEVSYSVLNN